MSENQKHEDDTDAEAKWLAGHPEMGEWVTLHEEMVEWMTQPSNKHRLPRSDGG